ncbi:MAG TPA: hypothetical protein VK850_01155, partial [Candidatus Binatia bacterium]|nr:hypothetical protein [Candidatus Binatia bacterium]
MAIPETVVISRRNTRNHARIAQGPIEEIRKLQNEIDEYVGLTSDAAIEQEAALRENLITESWLAFWVGVCDNEGVNAEATMEVPRPSPKATPAVVAQTRQTSVDVYRGFVMFLMMAEVLHLSRVSRALPGNAFWSFL